MVYFNEPARAARVLAVYQELPALRLSVLQAARLFNIPVAECERVLLALVGEGRLHRAADGCYVAGGNQVGSAVPDVRRAV